MSEVKAVIFDMDGLMFDTETIYYQANQKIADELGMDYTIEDYKDYVGTGDDIYFPAMEKKFATTKGIETFRERSVAELEHQLVHGELGLKPGLLELLDYIKEKEITAVVASSTYRDLVEQLLKKADIYHYFVDFIGGDEVAETKPSPEIFNRAFEKTGIEKREHVLILEDSKNGVLAAEAAGIPVINVPDMVTLDEETQQKTVAVYDDLYAVIDYLENL